MKYLMLLVLFVLSINFNTAFAQNSDWFIATKYGDLETIKSLIIEDTDVNITDEDGQTALLIAIPYGYKEIVELLVNAGAE